MALEAIDDSGLLQNLIGPYSSHLADLSFDRAVSAVAVESGAALAILEVTPPEERSRTLCRLMGNRELCDSVMKVAGTMSRNQDREVSPLQGSIALHLLAGELMLNTAPESSHPLARVARRARNGVSSMMDSVRHSSLQGFEAANDDLTSRVVFKYKDGSVGLVTNDIVVWKVTIKTRGHENAGTDYRSGPEADYQAAVAAESRKPLGGERPTRVVAPINVPDGYKLFNEYKGWKFTERKTGGWLFSGKSVFRLWKKAEAERRILHIKRKFAEEDDCGWNPVCYVGKAAAAVYDSAAIGTSIVTSLLSGDIDKFMRQLRKLGDFIEGIVWGSLRLSLSWLPGDINRKIVDVIRKIVKALFGMAVDNIKALIAVLEGVIGFFGKLFSGDPVGALKALFGGITELLITPIVSIIAKAAGIPDREMHKMIKKIVDANPMFPLDIIGLVLGGISGAVDQVITKVIAVAKPIIISILEFVAHASKSIRKAMDIGFTAIVMIVNNLGTLKEIANMIVGKLTGPSTGPGLMETVEKALKSAWDALAHFNLRKFVDSFIHMVEKAGKNINWDRAARALGTPDVAALLKKGIQETAEFTKELYRRVSRADASVLFRNAEALIDKVGIPDIDHFMQAALPKIDASAAERYVRSAIDKLPERTKAFIANTAMERLTANQRADVMRQYQEQRNASPVRAEPPRLDPGQPMPRLERPQQQQPQQQIQPRQEPQVATASMGGGTIALAIAGAGAIFLIAKARRATA